MAVARRSGVRKEFAYDSRCVSTYAKSDSRIYLSECNTHLFVNSAISPSRKVSRRSSPVLSVITMTYMRCILSRIEVIIILVPLCLSFALSFAVKLGQPSRNVNRRVSDRGAVSMKGCQITSHRGETRIRCENHGA